MANNREYHLKKTYGITLAQYNQLLKKQNGGCGVCGKTPKEEGRALAVDHRHGGPFKGEVTGLLCNYHNRRLIGKHTDPELFRKAAMYLENHTGWFVPEKKRKRRKKRVRRR